MGAMKNLAIDLGIDVPAHLCERDLMKVPAGETPAQRWHRLAKLAIVRGCQLVTITDEHGDVCAAVTSGTRPNVAYKVNIDAMSCECPAEKPCTHLAFALLAVGCLPHPEPPAGYVHRSARVAHPVAETLDAMRIAA